MRTSSDLRKASSVTVNSFLLSLARADERRERMRRTLAEAGIKAEFVEAVGVETTSKEDLLSSCKSDGPWGVFQPGNMAFTISHALVWERFLASDAQYAAIFEDDIFISPELQLWLQDMGWWPEDCALVRLEFWCSRALRFILGTRAQTYLGRKLPPYCPVTQDRQAILSTAKAHTVCWRCSPTTSPLIRFCPTPWFRDWRQIWDRTRFLLLLSNRAIPPLIKPP